MKPLYVFQECLQFNPQCDLSCPLNCDVQFGQHLCQLWFCNSTKSQETLKANSQNWPTRQVKKYFFSHRKLSPNWNPSPLLRRPHSCPLIWRPHWTTTIQSKYQISRPLDLNRIWINLRQHQAKLNVPIQPPPKNLCFYFPTVRTIDSGKFSIVRTGLVQ